MESSDLAAVIERLERVEAWIASMDENAEFATKHQVAEYLNVASRTVLRLTDVDGVLTTTLIRGQRRWDMREVRQKFPSTAPWRDNLTRTA